MVVRSLVDSGGSCAGDCDAVGYKDTPADRGRLLDIVLDFLAMNSVKNFSVSEATR